MKKSSLAIIFAVATIFCAEKFYNNIEAFANDEEVGTPLSEKDHYILKAIIGEINSAAQSGDEQLVSKLLLNAVKRNPQMASRIVELFLADQSKSSKTATIDSIDASAIINNVVLNLQQQKGSDALVAAVLSSYNPAASSDNKSQETKTTSQAANIPSKPYLPPSLPPAGQIGSSNNDIPKENPNQTSPH